MKTINLNSKTKLSDLITEYPYLQKKLADLNSKFKMLNSPMGKIMIKKATISAMAQKSGMDENELINSIKKLIISQDATHFTDSINNEEKQTDSNVNKNTINWENKIESFKKIDVRSAQGNFFPALREQVSKMEVGEGIEIIQKFEPLPLYEVMEGLGFERLTKKIEDNEWHIYFYRTRCDTESMNIPFRPAALLNFPIIDEDLGNIAVNFWDTTWNDKKRYLPYETRLLLSLTNAVGAGRMRQATRELVKAYIHGIESKALDDVFELLAWNQGIGFFASEIGPSTLFKAYKHIKNREKIGFEREKIYEELMEKFGETNPDVKV